jgi:hypothetical protein
MIIPISRQRTNPSPIVQIAAALTSQEFSSLLQPSTSSKNQPKAPMNKAEATNQTGGVASAETKMTERGDSPRGFPVRLSNSVTLAGNAAPHWTQVVLAIFAETERPQF